MKPAVLLVVLGCRVVIRMPMMVGQVQSHVFWLLAYFAPKRRREISNFAVCIDVVRLASRATVLRRKGG